MRERDRRALSRSEGAVKQVQSSIGTSYPKVPLLPAALPLVSEACLVQIEDRLGVVVDSEVSLLLPHARVYAARITVHQRCKDMWRQKRHWLRLADALS